LGEIVIILRIFLQNFIQKYEFTLKERQKMKMENSLGTKSWRKILEGLKRKVGIFIGPKTYLTQIWFYIWVYFKRGTKSEDEKFYRN